MVQTIITYLLIGALLGALYFYGLWGSLLLMPKFQNKKAYLLITTIIRFSILLTCFYFIIKTNSFGIMFTIIGFVISRIFIVRNKGLNDFVKGGQNNG
ncbi:MAG: N-ATPase, AtpR subunit [Alphaproteobacteria bacterium ADurb.Bin438]|nr:MAG: N-ATPase, AtpR subunit [Alphaproteobacteria bacterium ADurb.Bin438]